MIYSSLLYIYGFLPVSLLLFYIAPKKHREALLLGLSVVFCASFSLYFLIFITIYTLINYTMCRITEYLKRKNSIAEVALASTIILDITVLFAFRAPYMRWFAGMIRAPETVYPVGISLFTLSVISYLTDIYKGREKAETDVIRYSLYVMFFPRLIMGPIMRYRSFRKIMNDPKSGLVSIGEGIAIIVRGLVKKVLFSETLYTLYTDVFKADVIKVPMVSAWLGMTAYLLGIYFEMSGYADMGAGTARCFGYRFPECFRYPVFSKRISYFTVRWNTHIMLWFRRYLSKPLGSVAGNRSAGIAAYLFVWSLMGYWYTFSFRGWAAGLFLGTAVLIEKKAGSRNTLRLTGIIYTFIVSMIGASVFSGGMLRYAGRLIGTGGFADSLSLYLLREYTLFLIAAALFATDRPKKLVNRLKRSKASKAVSAVSAVLVIGTLLLCTALMAESGISEQLFITL